ncbi:MAG: 3-hydroxyacyl-CoA dehydrogenase family protein [Negativicutes bacterium]|nr:3-hydroxyacyl-CoA dehydrogenase family protein [Negativicutes bacterium]
MKACEIKKVACVGSGLIGSSWATNFAMKGYPVSIYDVKQKSLDDARDYIRENLANLQKYHIITEQDAKKAESLIKCTLDLEEAVKDVQFIQECGPENYEIKQKIFIEIEKYTPPDTIIASSTSGLLISEIAKYLKHPERCVGGHPFNPPHIIPLVEITKGEKSSKEVVEQAYEFYKLLGKEPIIVQKESLGFIANRLQAALYREEADLVMRGVCTVEDIDKALMFGPGLRYALLGQNMIFQLGGGQHGITGTCTHMNPSVEIWLADMAKWDKFPAGWIETAQAGVDAEMANREPEFGRTNKEISEFRDRGLFELLKLHKKI